MKYFTNSFIYCFTGSPILSQKHKVSSSVKEFPKKLSLFPLSPITPGILDYGSY